MRQRELSETTLTVVTSDHGELLGWRGRVAHGHWVDEEVLKVPLIFHGPGVRSMRRQQRVRLVDVLPTLLELANGVVIPSHGESLAATLGRDVDGKDRDVFAINRYKQRLVRVGIVGPWKRVQDLRSGAEHLFRVDDGYGDYTNRIASRADEAADLRDAIGQTWDRTFNDVMLARKLRLARGRELPAEKIRAHHRQIAEIECRRGDRSACESLVEPQAQ